jgi:type II secretory pathway pseudopilin PulG
MKLTPTPAKRLNGRRAFTLVEAVIAFAIFVTLLVGTMVGVQVFGLRLYTLGGTKLSAMQSGLKVLNNIRDAIRSSNIVDVGNLTTTSDPTTFTTTGTNANVGNALRIYSTTNTFPLTIYYLDTTGPTNYLRMATSSDGSTFGSGVILAGYITNLSVFDAEDYQGNILTNDSNNRIIRMELDFYQWEYPVGFVGGVGVNAYDYYKLTTKISRRLLD